jgi:hypothetical protein
MIVRILLVLPANCHSLQMCNGWLMMRFPWQVAYTFDAGPNAVLIAHNRKAATQLLQKLLFYFPPSSDADLNRYIVFQCQGHKRILVQCFGGYAWFIQPHQSVFK